MPFIYKPQYKKASTDHLWDRALLFIQSLKFYFRFIIFSFGFALSLMLFLMVFSRYSWANVSSSNSFPAEIIVFLILNLQYQIGAIATANIRNSIDAIIRQLDETKLLMLITIH